MYTTGIQSIERAVSHWGCDGEEAMPVKACWKTVSAVKQSIIQSAPCLHKAPGYLQDFGSPPTDCSN